MPLTKFCNALEKDVLQINMENISKELSDLMVTCERPTAMTQQIDQSNANMNANMRSAVNVYYDQHVSDGIFQKNSRVVHPSSQAVHTKHISCKPIVKHNLNLLHTQNLQFSNGRRSLIPNGQTSYPQLYPTGGFVVDSDAKYTAIAPKTYASLPNCEFPYLRPQTGAIKLATLPLISLANKDEAGGRQVTGTYRKYNNRTNTKFNSRPQNEVHDYKNIVVDISVLGLSKDGKESNPVLRMFALFRGLHNAIAEVPHTLEPPATESAYEPTFAPMPNAIMPCTMNVQHQVKYASNQVASFLCKMQHLLANNVAYDKSLADECESAISHLRHLLAQFEMYKFIDLEHKRGQFINDDVRVHAEHLEKLTEQMNRQIREVHVRVIVFDWYIGMKYRGENGLNKGQQTNFDGSTQTKRSEIGVVNEILQMCNTPTSMSAAHMETALITQPAVAASLELINSNDQFNLSMNTNNNTKIDKFVSDATDTCFPAPPAKTAAANTYVRQPVFYIG